MKYDLYLRVGCLGEYVVHLAEHGGLYGGVRGIHLPYDSNGLRRLGFAGDGEEKEDKCEGVSHAWEGWGMWIERGISCK